MGRLIKDPRFGGAAIGGWWYGAVQVERGFRKSRCPSWEIIQEARHYI